MTFVMTTSLLNVVNWTRGNMCVWVAFDHRRLPFASCPSPRVSEESSCPCRALQICLRTIWGFFFILAISGRVALGPLCSLRWPLYAVASHWSRLSIWCSSPSSPVVIASWTFAYHIGLGSTRPLRSMNDYSGHGSQLPFVRTPLNDLILAHRLSTIRTPCWKFQSPMSELHGNLVLLASTRSYSPTAALIGLCNVGF